MKLFNIQADSGVGRTEGREGACLKLPVIKMNGIGNNERTVAALSYTRVHRPCSKPFSIYGIFASSLPDQ